MPRFEPFPALRYAPDQPIAEVTAPPYDVLSAADRAALVARSDRNAVLIDLPAEEDGPDRYEAAGRQLRAWADEGVLVEDPSPTFTAYRMTTTDDLGRPVATLGVIGALTLARPDEGEILPHEHTTKKAKSDRLDLLRGTRANLSAIWGLSLSHGLTKLLGVDGTEPDQAWDDEDGTRHEVWTITDPERLDAISAAVGSEPVVVADGHHRYETSLAYRDERREADGEGGPADATLCYVVELTEEQLTVRPIHRLVTGRDAAGLEAALGDHPGLTLGDEVPEEQVRDHSVLARMADDGAMALVRPDGSARLVVVDPAGFPDVDDLDSARLAAALEPLGVEVVYQHGVDRVADAVAAGDADAGFLIRPVTVAAIEANAHSGARMPPKSTFFHPKPRTGIVFRRM